MDDTEIHYLTYDSDAIMTAMQDAYTDAGGDVLYPGDEKSMLMSAFQTVIMQSFAGIDNAIRMNTLRYAAGDYLDIIGENRGCTRIAAQAATATIAITLKATGIAQTMSAGTQFTHDGVIIYKSLTDVTLSGSAGEVSVDIECIETGEDGNALETGDIMQMLLPVYGVTGIVCTTAASGGMAEEDDDAYRARIRESAYEATVAGPAGMYESLAKGVSTEIIDAQAVSASTSTVTVFVIGEDATLSDEVISAVKTALDDQTVRPISDRVTVSNATVKNYTLNVRYYVETGNEPTLTEDEMQTQYREWQDTVIGRSFNPDRLKAIMYGCGCERVEFLSTSTVDGSSTIEYIAGTNGTRYLGTVSFTRVYE